MPTGTVRKLDDLGRLVIPMEFRRTLEIEYKTLIEIYVDSDRIILQKYKPSSACIFCGSTDEVTSFKGKNICNECFVNISKEW